jgi:hypothetical protein
MTHPAAGLALAIADQLADPQTMTRNLVAQPWLAQGLWHGMPGVALLHTELAAAGARPWQRVRDWLAASTAQQVTTGPHTNLLHGAPAIGQAFAGVASVQPGAYGQVLTTLDTAISADALRRVGAAHARMDAGRPAPLDEFDVIRGLAGVGAYLLRREPVGKAMRAVLEYLVRLADPITTPDGTVAPGWWTPTGPSGRPDNRYPAGHLNNGAAHGIAGPLALLGYAARAGATVPGQRAAITTITTWLRNWQGITAKDIPVWPYWTTPDQLHPISRQRLAQRPSWCYGTAGTARALQTAALAVGDIAAAAGAATALHQALTDPDHLDAAGSDVSLCHGYAGYALIAGRVSADGAGIQSPDLIEGLLSQIIRAGAPAATATSLLNRPSGPGLLEGAVGTALCCWTATTGAVTSWDSCLLMSSPHPGGDR